MRQRLVEDHDNARALADALASIPDLSLDVPPLLTNIVYVRVAGASWRNREIVAALKSLGVLCNAVGDDRMRFVTHHGITRADVETAYAAVSRAAGAC
jgi:threonine aldolase